MESYEAIEIDGQWFVFDHRHPDAVPYPEENENEARVTARVFNLLDKQPLPDCEREPNE